MKLTFGKEKKLKSRKAIEKIFSEGKSIHRFPVRAIYFYEENDISEIKIGVSVPKKKFKKAVDRNLLKRRIREAFRLNQNSLELQGKINLMFIYTGNEILPYLDIEKSIIALLGSLNSISNEHSAEK